ncbi:hypothetical protein BDW68DRAFT_177857 [Aspergillus falconensis]
MKDDFCGKCDKAVATNKCSCDERFCDVCFSFHLERVPKHRKAGGKFERAWKWATGTAGHLADLTHFDQFFKQDEGAKWFGLHVEKIDQTRVSRIIETPRFNELMEGSVHALPGSPSRQFPSLITFVGDTGAGKSTIIRSLIWCSAESITRSIDDCEAPIPAPKDASETAMTSTSGEVNLYPDPATYGTDTPRMYADCEGFQGTHPMAAKYQDKWHTKGRQYPVAPARGGDAVDRVAAVQGIYPKFLYIFSDVICIVTRNCRLRTQIAIRLLEWSEAGAQDSVNQSALPAAIIIINAPPEEHDQWISDDPNAMTNEFFRGVDHELEENNTLRSKASQKGDKTLKELLLRNFSSVHVHYIPDARCGEYATPEQLHKQNTSLFRRVIDDSKRVQASRAEAWTRFDTQQISIVFDCAFRHLASGDRTPFDFSMYRQGIELPDTVESHISQFLYHTIRGHGQIQRNFQYAAEVIGSCLVRRMMKLDRTSHARGHQNSQANHLADGDFVRGPWSTTEFLIIVENKIQTFLRELNHLDPDYQLRRRSAIAFHISTLQSASEESLWRHYRVKNNPVYYRGSSKLISMPANVVIQDAMSIFREQKHTNTCFVCLFGRPEYRLPCHHVLCEDCFCDFGDPDAAYPDIISHKSCILCRVAEPAGAWPVRIRVRPRVSGTRVLSLDGGGVRGIVELEILKRLENSIGVGLPIWYFFDLIVGTSAGGLIALGLGSHRWTLDTCIAKFNDICRSAFVPNFLTTVRGLGWISRWIYGSIYITPPLEHSLMEAYSSQGVFGLLPAAPQHGGVIHQPRVAVTTTVGTDCKLIANYNAGSSGASDYLNSSLQTWEAARCTSAAPMYFEEYNPPAIGVSCRDGGLQANNPVQNAVTESVKLWGEDSPLDVVLSIGSGQTEKPPPRPPLIRIPNWVYSLLDNLLDNMDGKKDWVMFLKNAPKQRSARACRLNPCLTPHTEPAIDAVDKISLLSKEAREYPFRRPGNTDTTFAGPLATQSLMMDPLTNVALYLRASLFYFHLEKIERFSNHRITVFKGAICCRLYANTDPFRLLLGKTSGFRIQSTSEHLTGLDTTNPFRLPIDIQINTMSHDELVKVEVLFEDAESSTPISGFPCVMNNLIRAYEQPVEARSQ